ncbi:MAG: M20 family metallopeptidase [Planctomycetota bacterium]
MQLDGSIASAAATLHQLIRFPSVSSTSNAEVNDWVTGALKTLGFTVTVSEYIDSAGVRKTNLVAKREPIIQGESNDPGGLAYFCHTDVVPADRWTGPENGTEPGNSSGGSQASPFAALQTEDRIYGRGACDMKGSLAAALSAAARVASADQTRPLWIVCTADEEVGFDGAMHLVEHCDGYRELVSSQPISIIGEPTELNVVYAHKGIRGFKVTSIGRAAHSATRHGINANESMVPMLVKLAELGERTRSETELHDARFDPPHLSWNFGVSDHMHVVNITPERCDAWVSIRPMPHIDGDDLFGEVEQLARELGLEFSTFGGCGPLWTDPTASCVTEMQQLSGGDCRTVCYATDGGVFHELNDRIVIGPGSIEQAHTADEWIALEQLDRGIDVYERAIRRWCC